MDRPNIFRWFQSPCHVYVDITNDVDWNTRPLLHHVLLDEQIQCIDFTKDNSSRTTRTVAVDVNIMLHILCVST